MSDHFEWPIIDFSLFPNEQISGLTLEEINDFVNEKSIEPSTSRLEVDNTTDRHFSNPVGDDQLRKEQEQSIPKGTRKRNNWALNLYDEWSKQRRVTESDSQHILLPQVHQLANASVESLNYWFGKFIFELRKKDGTRYPRDSLVAVTAGLNAYFKSKKRYLNLFKDDCFASYRDILDLACKESSQTLPLRRRQADIITETEEESMWQKNVLGSDTPVKLIYTLLYLNGLHFALRSGQEHRILTTDQLIIIRPSDTCKYYIIEYTETVSKTNSGGLKSRRLEPKKVKHTDINSIDCPERSHALLLQKYLSLRPPNSGNSFYLTPMQPNQQQWFKVSYIFLLNMIMYI